MHIYATRNEAKLALTLIKHPITKKELIELFPELTYSEVTRLVHKLRRKGLTLDYSFKSKTYCLKETPRITITTEVAPNKNNTDKVIACLVDTKMTVEQIASNTHLSKKAVYGAMTNVKNKLAKESKYLCHDKTTNEYYIGTVSTTGPNNSEKLLELLEVKPCTLEEINELISLTAEQVKHSIYNLRYNRGYDIGYSHKTKTYTLKEA